MAVTIGRAHKAKKKQVIFFSSPHLAGLTNTRHLSGGSRIPVTSIYADEDLEPKEVVPSVASPRVPPLTHIE